MTMASGTCPHTTLVLSVVDKLALYIICILGLIEVAEGEEM